MLKRERGFLNGKYKENNYYEENIVRVCWHMCYFVES